MFVAVQFLWGLRKLHLVRIKIELLKIFFSRFFSLRLFSFFFVSLLFSRLNSTRCLFLSFLCSFYNFHVSELLHVIMKIILLDALASCFTPVWLYLRRSFSVSTQFPPWRHLTAKWIVLSERKNCNKS